MPRDGTVFQLTSNVILFLEQLLDFVETVASILQQDSSYNQVKFNSRFEVACKKFIRQFMISSLVNFFGDLVPRPQNKVSMFRLQAHP